MEYATACPYADADRNEHIRRIFAFARQWDLDIDFHLDFNIDLGIAIDLPQV